MRDNFITFATFGDDSGANGFFGNGEFDDTPLGGAAAQDLYLVVTDTAAVGTASEIAVFTNTSDINWTFPASELAFSPSPSLENVVPGTPGALVLAGAEVTSPLTEGGPAIQLTAVPEPSTALLGLLGAFGLLRRRR